MKHRGLLLVFIVAALITFGLSSTALAFHAGGVAACDGCHTMHSSTLTTLTKGSDPSSTCLNCHKDTATSTSTYHVMSENGSIFHAGGDFFWLTRTFGWDVQHGQNISHETSEGENHGHNVVAEDFGLVQDMTLTQAPGAGANNPPYQAKDLACSSCHDPHGTIKNKSMPIGISGSYGDTPPAGTIAGNYRLLAGDGYQTHGTEFDVLNPVQAVSTNDRKQNDTLHTDYGAYMSEWCGNCHGLFLSTPNKHPVGAVNGDLGKPNNTANESFAETYSDYVRTGDFGGGDWPQSSGPYLELVPFERGANSILSTGSTNGPDTGGTTQGNVMCLTCHRAHASAFDYSGRWDFTVEYMVDSHPQTGDSGTDGITDPQNTAYYGRNMLDEYGEYQRNLCNKCHAKD